MRQFGLMMIHGLVLGKITELYRHAVKGLSADTLEKVHVATGDSFPDDRRFALLKASKETFDPQDPEWLHKENFLCVFTDPHLMARYRASYSIQVFSSPPWKDTDMVIPLGTPSDRVIREGHEGRFLTLWERSTDTLVLGPLDMSTEQGRQDLATFFSEQSGTPLTCVTANNHQFGNTSSGWKQKKDTRTIHLVTEATVKALQTAIETENKNIKLRPARFRPNIVLQGTNLKPFSEFDWIGKSIRCGPSLRLKVISKTVRCKGVSIDPLDSHKSELDIPGLLVKHFPEHGPYFGVYAVVENGGEISVGDDVHLI